MSTAPAEFVRALPDSLIAAFYARTEAIPGGHLAWTGARDGHGVGVLTHHGARYTAARIGFRLANGTDPVGPVKAGCGMPGCVEPRHLDDRPRRLRDRAALRLVLAPSRPLCAFCEEPVTEGRVDTAYCGKSCRQKAYYWRRAAS
ncbi:hypothetical protein OG455_41745 [Kitasatospora sp. NBC_01287]|uniref:hypothetical protein n=1 Tax=Kitasatospora sp. NBC_01287 TaxID=2903573 RepID=UPI002251A354|nr:hypothetical protein [Kitasatospora sp. NBC_01287]MCX4751740.1 hypothetical protein [Kitasatospora sp. NBC_01287]MCX4751968.1 hypothetical protein [Kitasatospora sp. NBC_01287]